MPSDSNRLEIADPDDIDKTWQLSECPRRMVQDIVEEINLAQMADAHLPCSGGVMDQDAWWVQLWMTFRSDCSEIESDQIKRARHG